MKPNLALFAVSSLAVFLTGCGMGPISNVSTGTLHLQGMVHGGQQPVTGSAISLYAAGKNGNGSASVSMLQHPVSTDSTGSFNISSDYSCTSASDQVYIVATGGNPGLSTGTNNNALVMMAALGNCGNLPATSYIFINEITTVAAAWALAPFMTDAAHVGASSTNAAGLQNAFLNAQLIANTTNGTVATPVAGMTLESGKVTALADALAPCVNSNGSGCSTLFAAATTPALLTSSSVPSTTLNAALNIVKYPGFNATPVYNAIGTQPPFPTTLTQAPNDWTLSLKITNGGLNSPTALGVDQTGNVWVANYFGTVSAFTPQGTAFNSTGYGAGAMNEVFGLTIDPSGNIWVPSQEQPDHSPGHGSLVELLGAASGSMGTVVTSIPSGAGSSPYIYDSMTDFPIALASDASGNIAIANYANSTGSIYCPLGCTGGGYFKDNLGSGYSAFPVSIAFDTTGGVWMANEGSTTVSHVKADGTVANSDCCSAPDGLALDASGNAWIADYYDGAVALIDPNGNQLTLVDGGQDGGLATGYPSGIALDAAQNVWVADFHGPYITAMAGSSNYAPAGTAISPNGYGLDIALQQPFAVAPDASGNIWLSDKATNTLILFFGLATPTKTPKTIYPVAP